MLLDRAHDGGTGRRDVIPALGREHRFKALLVEGLPLGILGLGDAVAVNREQIVGLQEDASRLEARAIEHAERDATRLQALDRAVRTEQQRGRVSRVDVGELAAREIEHGIEDRDEPVAGRLPADLHIQSCHEIGRLEPFVGERPHHREQQRHEERRRAALAGDIADGGHELA